MSKNDRQLSHASTDEGVAAGVRRLLATDHELCGGLVDTVNHHLRTPLTAILGHGELMSEREVEIPAAMRQSLATVMRAGQRLNDVIAGICDLIDAAFVDPSAVDTVDVSELVAEAVASYEERAAQRGIRLRRGDHPVGPCVADASRVRRALCELLDNAVTYAPDGSTVHIATTTTSSVIQIMVVDHGEGIDAADRVRLSSPFERGVHPRQPLVGRGMGLALASATAASHRGRLSLSENLGGGLVACLELPVDFTQLTDAAAPPWGHAATAWSRDAVLALAAAAEPDEDQPRTLVPLRGARSWLMRTIGSARGGFSDRATTRTRARAKVRSTSATG